MPRYKLTIEYDGGPYAGWQRQNNAPSVQGAIEAAAEQLDQRPVTVQGAGRTDAGVHALGQVAHLDLVKDLTGDVVRDALNHHLRAEPIAILSAELVSDDFHARFSATRRHYLYRIMDRRPPLTINLGKVWWVPVGLDVEAIHEAAQSLVGQHDFTAFRDTHCQAKSPVKTIDEITLARVGREIHLTCHARSFLHSQVRSITGSLVEVGWGKWSANDFKSVLESADRSRCGPVAPPDGLYLMQVDYSDDTEMTTSVD